MAEINLERKKSTPLTWLWILAALVIAGLLIWGVVTDDDENPYAAGDRTEQTQTAQAGLPIGDILNNPSNWVGRTVKGEVAVAEVPTDRGFWVTQNGERLFVLLDPRGEETPYRVEPNSRVRISKATVRDASYRDQVSGQLSAETRQILQNQDVFLVSDGPDVEIATR